VIEIATEEARKKILQLKPGDVWNLYREEIIGGKLYKTDLFNLLFWDETLSQNRERFIKKHPDIANKKINGGKFILNPSEIKLTIKDFEEINASIRTRVNKDYELQELMKEGRNLYKQAERVGNSINELIEKTSKKI